MVANGAWSCPKNGTAASHSRNVDIEWLSAFGDHITIVMSRLRDSLFCGTPLATANCMNHETLMNDDQFESTYALLVRSEEKGRGVLETVLYVAFILSAVLLIWEFAQSSVSIPPAGLEQGVVSRAAKTQMVSRS